MPDILSQMNVRTFLLSIIGGIAIVFVCAVTYLIVPEFKHYRSISTDLGLLRGLVNNKSNITTEINSLSEEVIAAKRRLKGDMANLPEKEMEAYIIGVLQNISWNNDIKLIGVKPSKGSEIHIFQEILFNVKLSGDYFDLYNWFVEIREDLGFIVIKQLNLSPMRSNSNDVPLLMELTIASYKSINQ